MGGRRPSRIRDIAGSSSDVVKFTKKLTQSIKKKDVQGTLDNAFKIASSEQAVENFAHGMSLLGPLHRRLKDIENKKLNLNSDEREKIATEELSKLEKEKGIKISSGIRELIIRSAKKSLKGDEKWKK